MSMMIYGPFRFGLDRLAFQEASRSAGYTWAEVERIGTNPALQFTGREAEVLTLPGVFHPHFRGGLSQLPAMRLAAEQGVPLPLITGYGFFLGLWVIQRIDETQSVFFRDGAPRKVDFVIELKQYASGLQTVSSAIGAISRIFS
jgi:phage protein U